MDKRIRIAIDGPAGAGKSTMAKRLAAALCIDYIDTGAMYRALGLKLLRGGTDYTDEVAVLAVLADTDIDFDKGRVYLDGEDVSGQIRTPQVSEAASASSAFLKVREKLAGLQRQMGLRKSIVMDGRDIASVVLPDAECKFYLDASVRVRALRRAEELRAKGMPAVPEEIEADIAHRDYRDMHRENSPLVRTPDAMLIDTSDMNIEEVVAAMLAAIKEKTDEKQ